MSTPLRLGLGTLLVGALVYGALGTTGCVVVTDSTSDAGDTGFVDDTGLVDTGVGDTGTDRDIEWWSIRSALERLPEEQRLAVALVLVEGLSYREAAQVMEVPIGTLTSRLARGRLALQAMLTEQSITRVARED